MNMKKIIFFLLIFSIVTSIIAPTIAYAENCFNWYCVRNKDHKQPKADANMQFVENYGGYYIDHVHNDENPEKVIYLTFDAGYENGNIARILDTLKEEKVKGCFFVLENLISKNPELIKRMVNEGHIVANHTSTHIDITKNTEKLKAELEGLEKSFYEVTGMEMPKFFRCPEGRFDERSMKLLNELGYKTIFWSFAYADWDNANQMSSEKAKEKILSNIHNGAILLLHPTSSTNANILKDIITELKSQGYSFGDIYELVVK